MTDLYSMFYTIGGMVMGGGIVHMLKRYTENSDTQEKTLPVVQQSIEALMRCNQEIMRSIEELYQSRNEHNVEIAKINTLHGVLGCGERKKT